MRSDPKPRKGTFPATHIDEVRAKFTELAKKKFDYWSGRDDKPTEFLFSIPATAVEYRGVAKDAITKVARAQFGSITVTLDKKDGTELTVKRVSK